MSLARKDATLQPRFRHGQQVKVIASPYAQVSLGEIGKINGTFHGGFGVEFTKSWNSAIPHHAPMHETRVMWFTEKELELYVEA